MRRLLGLVAVAAVLAAAGPVRAAPSGPAPLAAERDRVAYCLRATGAPGGLALATDLRGERFRTALVTGTGTALAPDPSLPIAQEGCATVAIASDGATVAAAPAYVLRRRAGSVVAWLRDPGGRLTGPLTVSGAGSTGDRVAAAVAPGGAAVVAWFEKRDRSDLVRVVAARRPPGGGFAPPRALTGWTTGYDARLAAGADASGGLVVAWAVDDQREDVLELPTPSRVGAARAPAGSGFGPSQQLADGLNGAERIALAVAPDGRALVAVDGDDDVQTFEAAPGGPFATGFVVRGTGRNPAFHPAVAIRDGGGAVLAWRRGAGSGGVAAATRPAAGAFGPARRVSRNTFSTQDRGRIESVPEGVFGGPENIGPHVAAAPDGRVVLAWVDTRIAPGRGVMPAARLAAGTLAAGVGRPAWLGSRCRAANATAALLLAGGEPAAAFTDNRSNTPAAPPELETPRSLGRVHLVLPGRPAATPAPPPRVTVRARPQALFREDALEVEARCDRPCDLRAVMARGSALGTATLRSAGARKLRLEPGLSPGIARRRSRRVGVLVHACSPDGTAMASARVAVRVRRRRPPPVPRVLDVRLTRRDGRLRLAWRTDRPAWRVEFRVQAQVRSRTYPAPAPYRELEGRGRRRFAVRFPARRVHEVELVLDPYDRERSRRVVVPAR